MATNQNDVNTVEANAEAVLQEYFANQDREACVSTCERLVESYYKDLNAKGVSRLWGKIHEKYNGALCGDESVRSVGEQGELSSIRIGHLRNLAQHVMSLTINQRPAFEPRATNTDVTSQTQTILARGLLDYYMREKRLERFLRTAVEHGLTFAEGFVSVTWNATTGEVYATDPETGAMIHEGDVEYTAYEPYNVIRDVYLEDWSQCKWVILRKKMSKYELAAKYPELASEIVASSSPESVDKYSYRVNIRLDSETDLIDVFTLLHARTPAVPDGRQMMYINGSVVLNDGPLPYRQIPVYRLTPADVTGTTRGYSVLYDILAVSEAIDALYSAVLTNQLAFGVQNITSPKGNNLSVTEVGGGMRMIEYDSALGKPESLNLTHTPAEVFNFIATLEKTAETLSGINSVARGDPQASLKSGAALALVQSMAVQFAQQFQSAYIQLLEDVGTATVNILRDFAAVPRIAMIAGKSNRGIMKEFTGKDLSQINRVIVDAGNPMARTTAGKVELAQMMLQGGMIKTPDQMLQVIQTGNLDPLTEGPTAELLAVKAENEELNNGVSVPVMITDNHLLHINEHKCIVSDPAARADPQIVQTVTQHIMEHYAMLSDPSLAPLLTILGQVPVPPTAGPTAAPVQGANVAPTGTELAGDLQPNMPSPPTNPMTGEPAELPQPLV